MSKYTMTTVIELEFLKVEEGQEYILPVPEDSSAEDLAYLIRSELHQGGIILSNVYIDHEFREEN